MARTMAELNRIADRDQNTTSKPDWWRQRSAILNDYDEAPDWDTSAARKAISRLEELEMVVRRGIRNGQLAIEVDKAYRMLTAIAARRPELIEGQDMDRWEQLWMEV